MKKASELSILCDAEVAVIVFSNTGKLYDFSSSSMTELLKRHRKCSFSVQDANEDTEMNSNLEFTRLKETVESLERSRSHLLGEDLDSLTVQELQQREKQLEGRLKQVISIKTQLFFDQIQELRKQERMLQGEYESLHKKFSELQAQYACDQYPIQISGSLWHAFNGKYMTHVHSPHCAPTIHIRCPSAHTGNTTTGQKQSGNYATLGWLL